MLIALKYLEDINNNNRFYSKVIGIRNEELCQMEIEYLELIEYNLFVEDHAFKSLVVNLNTLFNMNAI